MNEVSMNEAEIAFESCKGKRNNNLEKKIIKDDFVAYLYARDIVKGRWQDAEEAISKGASAIQYARDVVGGRWAEAEKYIAESPRDSYIYARDVVRGRFEEGENAIIKDSFYILQYAKLIKRLPEKLHRAMVLLSFEKEVQEDVREYFAEFCHE